MADSGPHECMVEVDLVRMERTLATEYPLAHDPDSVEHRHAHDGKHHSDQVGVLRHCDEAQGSVAPEDADREPSHDHSDHHGPRITEEHPALLSEDIVEQEGQSRGSRREGKHGVGNISDFHEHAAENQAAHYAEAAAEAVHPIDHVDGIDYSHPGENGQGHGKPPAERPDAPQSMETVDAASSGIDQPQDSQDLDYETGLRSESDDIVDSPGVEHHDHRTKDRRHGFKDRSGQDEIGRCAGKGPGSQPEEHGNPSQDRHRQLLQLAGIRVVNYHFLLRDLQDLEINPLDRQERRQRSSQDNDGYLHLDRLFIQVYNTYLRRIFREMASGCTSQKWVASSTTRAR